MITPGISMGLPSSAPDVVMVIYFVRKKMEKEDGARKERPVVIKTRLHVLDTKARRPAFLPFSSPTGEQLGLKDGA